MPLLSSDLADAAYLLARDKGWRLLQPFRYGPTVAAHVGVILAFMQAPKGARILDVGCGTGEVARLMAEQRPDLDFDLLNFSEPQLEDCPAGSRTYLADAHQLPFDDGTFDVVMFNFALGNMDSKVAFAEAIRVLKVGGIVLINEMFAQDGAPMAEALHYRPLDQDALSSNCEKFGAKIIGIFEPRIHSHFLREEIEDYSKLFDGVLPRLVRVEKKEVVPATEFTNIFARHSHVALALSGGKDSAVCLHLLDAWLDRISVYWTNPGNPLPETLDYMREVAARVPYFKEIRGRQPEVIAADGWPSDVVPQRYTADGNIVFGATPFKVQTRLSCCWRSLMLPMHEAILADGVTCIIRGKRREEADKTGLESGFVSPDGVELCFPLMEWKKSDVFEYLDRHGIPVPAYYEHAGHSLDCMDCTAWWGEGLSRYLENKHPDAFVEYKRRLLLIKQAVAEQMADCEV